MNAFFNESSILFAPAVTSLCDRQCVLSQHTDGQRGSGRHQILKNDKATGIDAIHAEMLNVDLPTSVGILCPFSMKCGNEKKYQKIGKRV